MRSALCSHRLLVVVPLLLLALATAAVAQDRSTSSGIDPHKIKGAVACGECHVSEFEVWKKTPHAKGFKTLHRQKAAENIAEKMGFRLIKRESLCLNCHYTPIFKGESLRAASGVSCESCHGAGSDWINIHNNYGGKGITHATESAEHKQTRIKDASVAGMRRPSDLYPVITSCFSCHTVPEEELVNKGGHTTGSSDFEFVSWMDKNIRHNFLHSFLEGDGTDNAERSVARKRIMYVVGRAMELEYSLRGMAAASQPRERYANAMSRRIRNAVGEIGAIRSRAEVPELEEMLLIVRGVQRKAGNGKILTEVAHKIGALTRKFLDRADGETLAALDPLVLGTAELTDEEEVAESYPLDPETPDSSSLADPMTPDNLDATPVTAPAGDRPIDKPNGVTRSQPRIIPGVAASGQIKTRIRPKSDHALIGPSKCENCHGPQAIWWAKDKHYTSLDPFFERDPKAIKIATLYGLRSDQMARGNRVCMNCHATVLPGRERRDARDGVGCEACHGPAKDYLKPHEFGEKTAGLKRSGYLDGLKLGMTELKNPETRAKTCSSCHYLTDERLLSAGHPSGEKFDYLKSMDDVKHWEHEDPGDLIGAYSRTLAGRGPVPEVTLARLPQRIAGEQTSSNSAVSADGDASSSEVPSNEESNPINSDTQTAVSQASRERVLRPSVPSVRPVISADGKDSPALTKLLSDPYPEIGPGTPIEEILIFLKQRLEALYRTAEPKEGKP